MRLAALATSLRRSASGSAAVEAAIAAPLMVMLTIGTVETARLLYAHMAMQRLAAGAAGELSQDDRIDPARVADLLGGARHLAAPFDLDGNGRVFLTVVEGRAGAAPRVVWQAADSRPLAAASRIGAPGGDATLPDGFSLAPSETVAIAEVYYAIQPLLAEWPAFGEIYKAAVLRPRVGELRPSP